jgi:hypothetical protein
MPLPNFLIIGAGKSGTSSLYYYLQQHPEVFMCPVKEPNFFAYDPNHKGWNGPAKDLGKVTKTLEDYLKLYEGVRNEKAIGEASPSTFHPFGCQQVRRYIPDARLICILRQPVDAAYSAFLHRRRDRMEPESDFLRAYRSAKARIAAGWAPMLYYPRYYSQPLKYWLSQFSREQFRFYLTEELKLDPFALLRNLFQFLGVDENFQPALARKNTAHIIRSQTVRQMLANDRNQPVVTKLLKRFVPSKLRYPLRSSIQKWNNGSAPRLNPQLRNKLTLELRDEILRVQELIQRDLSLWLKEV